MRTLRERQTFAESIPWVSRLEDRQDCDGIVPRWGYACSKPGAWKFTSLAGDVNTYCWRHLLNHGLYVSPEEIKRIDKWWQERNKSTTGRKHQ